MVKHASARKLTVRLESIEGKVVLMVHDDGVGFDTEKINEAGHFGLAGIQERARLAGGQLDIVSKPGYGTTIRLTL